MVTLMLAGRRIVVALNGIHMIAQDGRTVVVLNGTFKVAPIGRTLTTALMGMDASGIVGMMIGKSMVALGAGSLHIATISPVMGTSLSGTASPLTGHNTSERLRSGSQPQVSLLRSEL